MCGICGFFGKGELRDLKAMQNALSHRGPDASGYWIDETLPLFIGHTRLSIIDITTGQQPMWLHDGSIGIVYNGELYNHQELREYLSQHGCHFQTDHSDTEVLLNAYHYWGAECVERFNGMWAFAIYDVNRQKLFLSRDRFGKKPLYYTWQNNTFAFASELKALTSHGAIKTSLSPLHLKKYFAYGYIPAPGSIYRQIHKLPGGHHLFFNLKTHTLNTRQYWDFVIEPFEKIPQNPEEVWGEQIRALLEQAVKRRLMSDVPLGIFLSGGIDSSAITAFASRHVDPHHLKTFSMGFAEKSFDESHIAQTVSRLYHTQHTLNTFSMENMLPMIPAIVRLLDEPMGDVSLLPTFLLSQATKKEVSVALGGDGGDELFAGYDPFLALKTAAIYQKIMPPPLHRGIRMLLAFLPVSHQNLSLDFKLKRFLRGIGYPKPFWNPIWMGTLEPKEITGLFDEPVDIEELFAEALSCWETCRQNNLVDQTLQFFTKLYLENDILVKTDRAGMMNSLEIRAPFLDIELVDFVRRIPHQYKLRNGTTKYLLKKALAPVLPHAIRHRSKKGFGVPVGRWFKNQQLRIKQRKLPLLNPRTAQKIKLRHQKGLSDERLFLWNHYLLEHFLTDR